MFVLKTYLNLQNLREMSLKCTTSTLDTNMNILIQLSFKSGFSRDEFVRVQKYCLKLQTAGAGAGEVTALE